MNNEMYDESFFRNCIFHECHLIELPLEKDIMILHTSGLIGWKLSLPTTRYISIVENGGNINE